MDTFLELLTENQLAALASAVYARRAALALDAIAAGDHAPLLECERYGSKARAAMSYSRRTGCSVVFAKTLMDGRDDDAPENWATCDDHMSVYPLGGACPDCLA